MMSHDERIEAAIRMNPALYLDIYEEFNNSPQLQWTALTVVLNMLLTLAMWIGIYGMEHDSRFSESYFLKSGSDYTTGNEIYDGMLNGFGTICVIGVVSFVMLGFALLDFQKIVKVWLTTSCLVILYGISGSTIYDMTRIFLDEDDPVEFFIAVGITTALTIIYGTFGVLAFFFDFSLILHQFYVISNCSLIATFYLRIFPGNTTWFVLWIVSLWDIFAVSAPIGPLKKVQEKAADYSNNVLRLLMFTADEKRNTTGRSKAGSDESVGTRIQSGVRELIEMYSKKEAQDEDFVQKIRERRKRVNPDSSNVSENSPIVDSPMVENVPEESDSSDSEYVTTEDELVDENDVSTCDEMESEELEEVEQIREEKSAADALNDGESIRLGFGDFVFYSMLIGAAATSGNMFATVFAGFGVVLGLIITLTVLSTPEETTPALPMSVLLGTVSYFFSLQLMEFFGTSFQF